MIFANVINYKLPISTMHRLTFVTIVYVEKYGISYICHKLIINSCRVWFTLIHVPVIIKSFAPSHSNSFRKFSVTMILFKGYFYREGNSWKIVLIITHDIENITGVSISSHVYIQCKNSLFV